MKTKIIELIVDNTGVSTEQAKIIANNILKLTNATMKRKLIMYSEKYVFLPYPAQSGTHEDLVDNFIKIT